MIIVANNTKSVEDFAFFNAFSNGYVDLFSLILCF